MSDVTQILSAIEQGNPQASEQLLPLVYEELRRLACEKMAHENPGQTLQPTALVHEAYLRLVGPMDSARWESRGHFFAAAAEAMRRILVEAARCKKRLRHGGMLERHEFTADCATFTSPQEDIVAVHEAVDKLAAADAQAAELVKLHYFAGLTIDEAAVVLGVSVRRSYVIWAYARAWLFRCLGAKAPEAS